MNIINIIRSNFLKVPKSYWGSIFTKSPTDYELVGAIVPKDIPKPRHTFDECKIQYDQNLVQENSCSAHGTVTALSNLTGTTFSTQEIQMIWNQEVSKGNASPEWGGYTYKMIDAWRNYWNQLHPDNKVISFAVPLESEYAQKLIDAGYMLAMGYRWITNFTQDWWDGKLDRIVNGQPIQYGEFKNGGHCLSLTNAPLKNVDNYVLTRKSYNNNTYLINIPLKELVSLGIFHEYGYVFMFENDMNKNIINAIDKKLQARLNNRIIFEATANKFYLVNGSRKDEVKSLADLVHKFKWNNTNESYALGITKENFNKI